MTAFVFTACSGGTDNNTENSTENVIEKTGTEYLESESMGSSYDYEIKEIYCHSEDKELYGKAYIPDTGKKSPLVIFSHGLGDSHDSGEKYGELLAKLGYSVYMYDFVGGTVGGNKSTKADTTEMSVMTEADDLETVLNECVSWDFVDKDNIFLSGESQGGAVSAVVAAEDPGMIRGMILIYPAFCIPENVHDIANDIEDLPEQFDMFGGWITLGRIYAEDVWDYDFYENLENYDGEVLIIHGDNDDIVDISFSDRASDVLKNCEYHVIEGAGHGFSKNEFDEASDYIAGFLKRVLMV